MSQTTTTKPKNNQTSVQRRDCVLCHYHLAPQDESLLSTFSCNVRAFKGENFQVWRCPNCQTIHCLDVVDLNHYYSRYPIAQGQLNWPHRIVTKNLCKRLFKHGFNQKHSFLDYGCGANGLLLQYLREQGFTNCYGYDPYASIEGFGNPDILQNKPFDYILLQDVLEHVEDPDLLLKTLDSLLAPGGYILIGTPNASSIRLDRADVSDFYNPVHVPYHLHIYTLEGLEELGRHVDWTVVERFERSYNDLPGIFNARAWNQYQRLNDGTIDTIYEPVNYRKALTSYQYWFYALFGYWMSFKADMSILFQKPLR